MYEILKFAPQYKDYLWGGRRLDSFGKELPPDGPLAESWELSCQPNGLSVVEGGRYDGQRLDQLLMSDRSGWMGTDFAESENFPLLVKFIDAEKDLSVQVHPNDEAAQRLENVPYGKNEIWYVVYAPEGATLVAGLKPGTTPDGLAAAIAAGRCEDELAQIPVKAGDVINIPAGLVHAITAGLIVYEVQQSSDTTYRLYDYNRRGADGKLRPLHVDKGLEVIDFAPGDAPLRFDGLPNAVPSLVGDVSSRLLVLNRYISFAEVDLAGEAVWQADPRRFRILTCLDGSVTLNGDVVVERGRTVYLPAALPELTLSGEGRLLITWPGDPELREELTESVGREVLAAATALDPA